MVPCQLFIFLSTCLTGVSLLLVTLDIAPRRNVNDDYSPRSPFVVFLAWRRRGCWLHLRPRVWKFWHAHSRYICFFCELLFMLINCCSLVALEVVVKPTLEKLDFFHIRYGSYISWNISRVFQEYFHTTETFPCYGIGHNYGNWIFQPFAIFPKYFRTMEEV